MLKAGTALLALCAVWALLDPMPARAEVPVPPLTGRVVDLAGALPQDRKQALEQRLKAFEESKGAQVAVLILPTTAPEAIEQYSIRVAETWKLGREKSDDGAILVVALQDRVMRIEVGYGLEGALSDLVSKRIIGDIITPHFQAGDIAGGVEAGVDAMMKVIEGEPLPPPERWKGRGDGDRGGGIMGILPVLFVLLFVGGSIARAVFGRFLGGFLGGGAAGVLGGILTGSLILGGLIGLAGFFLILLGIVGGGGRHFGGRGGFLGGMGGGGFRGGGFGGFSGGGGGFGGGGASGRW